MPATLRVVVDAGLRKAPLRRRLSRMLAAVLPALMLAVLLPTHAEAAPSQPSKPTASSSDGVMTVNWVATTGATNGYQYRYSISSLCLPAGFNCDFEDKDKDWTDHGDAKDDTTLTLNELPTGRTYYFEVRGYDSNGATENDKYGPASGVSGGAFHRAAPGKLTGLTRDAAQPAGNPQLARPACR